jgi:hypothetical protein
MFASVRRYVGQTALADELGRRKDEVISVVSEAPGFQAYYLIKAGNDTVTVTVCDDESGAQRSNELAANWLREHAAEVPASAPEISAGEVLVSA